MDQSTEVGQLQTPLLAASDSGTSSSTPGLAASATECSTAQITVQDLYAQKHVLDAGDLSVTTVAKIKSEVQKRSGIPPDAQRLLLNGKTLEDETHTLQQYGVQPGCTVSLTLQDEAESAARRAAHTKKRAAQEEAQRLELVGAQRLAERAPAPQTMHAGTSPEGVEGSDVGQSDPEKLPGDGWRKGFLKSPHLCSVVLSICLLVPVVSMVIQAAYLSASASAFFHNLAKATTGGTRCNTTDCMPLLVPVVICWLLYWCEVLKSNSLAYLSNVKSDADVSSYVTTMKRTRPVVQWTIQCYHEKEKTDDFGNKTTERIDTHCATHIWQYSRCTDLTGSVPRFDRLTKVTFKKVLSFDNPGSRGNYHRAMAAWRERNNRDEQYDFSESMYHLPGFQAKMVADVSSSDDDHGHRRPACASMPCFCLASCVGCSAPWRWWFGSVSTTRVVRIHKSFSA